MSTLSVTNLQTANGTTNLTISTGNTSGPKIIINSSNGTITANTSTFTINGSLSVSGSISDAGANAASQTLTDGATISWNAASGRIASVTLGGNRTISAPTNLKIGTYILFVIQDNSGSRTLTWNSAYKWPAGIAPTLTTTANATDIMTFVSDGTNMYGTYINNVS